MFPYYCVISCCNKCFSCFLKIRICCCNSNCCDRIWIYLTICLMVIFSFNCDLSAIHNKLSIYCCVLNAKTFNIYIAVLNLIVDLYFCNNVWNAIFVCNVCYCSCYLSLNLITILKSIRSFRYCKCIFCCAMRLSIISPASIICCNDKLFCIKNCDCKCSRIVCNLVVSKISSCTCCPFYSIVFATKECS